MPTFSPATSTSAPEVPAVVTVGSLSLEHTATPHFIARGTPALCQTTWVIYCFKTLLILTLLADAKHTVVTCVKTTHNPSCCAAWEPAQRKMGVYCTEDNFEISPGKWTHNETVAQIEERGSCCQFVSRVAVAAGLSISGCKLQSGCRTLPTGAPHSDYRRNSLVDTSPQGGPPRFQH